MAANKIATVKGIFLKPGVSKNGRLYTKQNIASAVADMQTKIANNELPLTMATGHKAAYNDDALDTVGRIVKVEQQADGSATFEAHVANTIKGRDIANLVTGDDPFIKGVSIRGGWGGDIVSAVGPHGESAITSDKLTIAGIDFTHRPGVGGAEITAALLAEAQEKDPSLIFESADEWEFLDEAGEPIEGISETVDAEGDALDQLHELRESLDAIITEKDSKKPYGDVTYADNGYQKDGKKRYPIDTAEHVRAAWSYINVESNASKYTGKQVQRMKSKIKSAAKKFSIDVAEESASLAQDFVDVLEAYASSNFDNGAATISVSGYTDDAGKLSALGQRLALAAQAALYVVDPDADGDVDLVMPDGTPDSSSSSIESENDNNMGPDTCTQCEAVLPDQAMYCPFCGQPVPNAESEGSTPLNPETQEAIVPEPTATETAATEAAATAPAPVVETAPERKLTDADVTAIAEAFATALKPPVTEAPAATASIPTEAPAAPAATTTAPVATEAVAPAAAAVETYTAEQVQAKIDEATAATREATIAEAVETFRNSGGARKGLIGGKVVNPGADAAETAPTPSDLTEMAQMSIDEFRDTAWGAWESHLPPNLKRTLSEHDAAGYGR